MIKPGTLALLLLVTGGCKNHQNNKAAPAQQRIPVRVTVAGIPSGTATTDGRQLSPY